MGTSMRFSHSLRSLGFGVFICLTGGPVTQADPTTAPAKPGEAPQGSFMSSLTQAFKQDYDHQVVRGHFDVGSPPDTVRRYYCLVDAKTGKRQPNGVDGQPFLRPDGMTGIKGTAVSLYSCAGSEQQGLLVTTGYVLIGGAAAQAAAASAPAGAVPAAGTATGAPAGGAALPTAAPPPPVSAGAAVTTLAPPAAAASPPYRVDVAGVKLGMSLDEVRAVLKSKQLPDYRESTQTLRHVDPGGSAAASAAGTRFVNAVAAWTPAVDGDAEAFDVMFTPVPGRERVMAIVHSVAYSPARAVRVTALAGGLVSKYGGYTAADALPASPTWRYQTDGVVQTGDACKRRGLFGGVADVGAAQAIRPNLALQTTPEEFRYQIDVCGMAIVTEDHVVARDAAARGAPAIARFTVTAYGPSIAFEGATAAAQLMQVGARAEGGDQGVTRPPAAPVPDL